MAWKPDYLTLAEAKAYLRIDDNVDDVFLAIWITTVSRNVDDHCNRQFGQTALEERVYSPVYDRHLRAYIAPIDDVQNTTGLIVEDENGDAVDAETATAGGYSLWPKNAAANGRPYEEIRLTGSTGDITVTALYGWTAVPSAVKSGCLLQLARIVKRRDSPFGIAGSPSEGSEIRLLAQLDPDFRTALKPLRRGWWVR